VNLFLQLLTNNKYCIFHLPLPHYSSSYKYRRSDPLQHSVCCPLNRTVIMKTVILAVLLLLAVASIVSGAPAESGKSKYGHEMCLVVILQTRQPHKVASLFNYELLHDVWRNAGKTPRGLIPALETKLQVA
jgi:hypothetical protein